jgi:phospholipid/cholesterol/gamma-HCH transport system permease protein
MNNSSLNIITLDTKLSLKFVGEFSLYIISSYEKQLSEINFAKLKELDIDLTQAELFDTAAALFINKLQDNLALKNIKVNLICSNKDILGTLALVKNQKKSSLKIPHAKKKNYIEIIGKRAYFNYLGFISFMAFMGKLFSTKVIYLKNIKNIRYKEIAFEINESAVRALGIIALTSFLIGLVVAYQSAFQLKIYGANIFIVDMLGISILRELAPLITAIVIAGRSGSAFTAQIGAMKITQELDAMRTMGFDPYIFLVLPRIIALMIAMPILIFVSDIMGIIGGMVVANLDLNITVSLFLDRFNEVIAAKHFFIGIVKGPFFAFLIASIGIYRGMMVKDDTQSIGFNTTKSVVESIFAVIVCDAVFSIAFTNLGI